MSTLRSCNGPRAPFSPTLPDSRAARRRDPPPGVAPAIAPAGRRGGQVAVLSLARRGATLAAESHRRSRTRGPPSRTSCRPSPCRSPRRRSRGDSCGVADPMNIADLRTEYKRATLDERTSRADPFRQFERWFDEAVEAQLPEPNAMTLATVDADGRPAARIVLLKVVDDRGFVFFTNYESRKGRELAANPARGAALLLARARAAGAHRGRRRRRSTPPSRPPISPGGRARRSSARGRRRKASRSRSARALEARFAEAEARYRRREPRRAVSAALGRLSPRPRRGRVLAGSRLAAARSHSLSTRPTSTPARGSSTGSRRERRRRARLAHARRTDRARDRQSRGADGKPGDRLARRAVAGRVAVHRRRADGALRAAADVPVASRRAGSSIASACAGRCSSGSVAIGIAAALPVAFPGLPVAVRRSDAARRRLHGVPGRGAERDRRDRRRRRRARATSACSRSATRCRASSGPLLAGFAIDHFGFRAAFAIFALMPLIPIVGARARPARAAGPACRARAPPTTAASLALLRHRTLRRVFAVNALLSLGWDLHTIFVPIYGAKIGLSASQIGGVLASFARGDVRRALLRCRRSRAGCASTRCSPRRCSSRARVFFAFPFLQSVPALIALSFTLGLGLGAGQPMVMSLLHTHAPPGRMGEAAGVRMSLVNSMSCRGAARRSARSARRSGSRRCSGRSAPALRPAASLARRAGR